MPIRSQLKPADRLRRVLELESLLRTRQTGPPAAIAKRFGVTKRTIMRDLALLAEAGVSIAWDRTKCSYVINGGLSRSNPNNGREREFQSEQPARANPNAMHVQRRRFPNDDS